MNAAPRTENAARTSPTPRCHAIDPLFLGFGALLASALSYEPAYTSALSLGQDALNPFVIAALSGASLLGALLCVVTVRRSSVSIARLRGVGATGYIVGTLGFLLLVHADLTGSATSLSLLYALCGFAAGAGGLFVFIAWGELFAQLELKQAVTNFALAVGASSCVSLLLSMADDMTFSLVFVALLTMGALLPCARPAPDTTETVSSSIEAPDVPRKRLLNLAAIKSSMQILLAPFLGLLVFGFVGLLMDPDAVANSFGLQTTGFVAGIVLLFLVVQASSGKPIYPLVYQVFLPLLALCAMAARILAGDGVMASLGFDLMLHVVFGAAIVFAMASLAGIAHARELPGALIFASAYALYCLFGLLGLCTRLLAGVLGFEATSVALVVWVAYFMFQALFPTIAAWNADYAKPETSSETNQAPDAEATLTARCEAVARRCELSPRETEIFYYLGRGHSSMYISQTLLISDSTVRTHIKNIYRKCGVSSREEILELVDADAQGTEADEAAGRL